MKRFPLPLECSLMIHRQSCLQYFPVSDFHICRLYKTNKEKENKKTSTNEPTKCAIPGCLYEANLTPSMGAETLELPLWATGAKEISVSRRQFPSQEQIRTNGVKLS